MGTGILTGLIRELPHFEPNDFRLTFYDFFKESKFSNIMELLKTLAQIAESHDKPNAQIAINWITQKDEIAAALVGVRNSAEANENCNTFNWELTNQEIRLIDDEIARLKLDE